MMMKYLADRELAAWLAFNEMGVGWSSATIMQIYNEAGELAHAWEANRDQLRFVPVISRFPHQIDKFLERRSRVNPERLLQSVKDNKITAIPMCDQRYPLALKQMTDAPLVLYMKGKLRPEDFHHPAGVVGTRRPTTYGQRLVKEIAAGLASNGVTIISGMAIGIDSFAHRAAIESGGRTIAVLGCGVDVCYPSSNRPLYEMLISGEYGAVISEYSPGTKPDTWRFPARNRIIAGLSEAVVVVEAGENSGSLITADLAFHGGRQVYAVPGRVDAPMSLGTNYLIASHKAQLVTNHQDVMRHLGWVHSTEAGTDAPVVELYGREKEVYEMLSNEPVHFDLLCERTGMSAGELSATLTMLELAGVVTRHPGDWYTRS